MIKMLQSETPGLVLYIETKIFMKRTKTNIDGDESDNKSSNLR